VLTAPLLVMGGVAAFRSAGMVRALLLGLVLTTAAMFVLLPYQGHGWGYRYLHGLLGSAVLLAAWTWDGLLRGLSDRSRAGAGAAFAPAAPALRVLATMCVLTYVAIVYAQTLIMLGRPWALAKITGAGLVVNVGLNLIAIRHARLLFGLGGGGTGCAFAMFGTEVFVTTCMIAIVGRRAFDRRSAVTIGKSLGACAVVILAHRTLAGLGAARLALDGVLYVAIVLSTGALEPKTLARVVRDSLRTRRDRTHDGGAVPTPQPPGLRFPHAPTIEETPSGQGAP